MPPGEELSVAPTRHRVIGAAQGGAKGAEAPPLLF